MMLGRPVNRATTAIALPVIAALIGCSHPINRDGRSYRYSDGLPANYSDDSSTRLEHQVRQWLASIHMDATDAICFVHQAKASPLWRSNPPAFSMTKADSLRLAEACGIDLSKLYTFQGSD